MQELLSASDISLRVSTLGEEIRKRYDGQLLTVIGVLKGSFIFLADLVRAIDSPSMTIDFLAASSYGNSLSSSGEVRITADLVKPIEGRHILLVEDIVDTGLTIHYLLSVLQARNPSSIAVCALLHKPSRKKVEVPIDYLGFTIEDHFVVGYGLDFDERYRNLPYIGIYEL